MIETWRVFNKLLEKHGTQSDLIKIVELEHLQDKIDLKIMGVDFNILNVSGI